MRPTRTPRRAAWITSGVRRALLVALALTGACADQTFRTTQNFDRPLDVALSCWQPASNETGSAEPVPLAVCTEDRHDLYGFVTNTEQTGVSVLDLIRRQNIDVPYGALGAQGLPGYTRARVGSMPAVIVSHPTSRWVYTVNRGSSDISRIDTTPFGTYAVRTQPLPLRPHDAVVGPYPGEAWVPWEASPDDFDGDFGAYVEAATDAFGAVRWALYVSAPAEGGVLVVPLDADRWGELGGGDMLLYELTGGAPTRLALTPDGTTLYATHQDRGYVSAVDLATGAEERLWIAAACGNGVDDDGDGLVDAADPGCDDRADEHEGDPERGDAACGNELDDDGDGLVDGDDPGCGDEPAIPACANGIDDDGDELVDMDDPGCASPRDDSEVSDQLRCAGAGDHPGCTPPAGLPTPSELTAIELRCGNGVDDDGDGRTDDDDGGLAPGDELAECPGLIWTTVACWNGLDDDEDGAVDDGDACPTPFATGEAPPACRNGVDDDGDGLVDWPADPGCYDRDGATEQDPLPPALTAVAVSPDGAFVYVGDGTSWAVHVIDRATGALLDVLADPAILGGHPVWRRAGRRGLQLSGAPRDIAFTDLPDDGVEAWVTTAAGTTTLVEAVHPGLGLGCDEEGAYRFEPRTLHRFQSDFEAAPSALSQPILLRGFEEIDLAFTVIPEFPTMGAYNVDREDRIGEDLCAGETTPQACCDNEADDDGDGLLDCADPDCADTDACRCGGDTSDGGSGEGSGDVLVNPYVSQQPDELRTYYGVTFTDDRRLHTSETWTIRYEGALPGTDRTGRFVDEDGWFHDEGVDYCALGVEEGDLFVIEAREGCYVCDEFVGETFEWRIAEVRADRLRLEGPGLSRGVRPDIPGATTVCLREAGVTIPPEAYDDFTADRFVVLADDLPLPTTGCFGGPVDYAIRVPDRYVVSGSVSGYLHNWRNDGGRCVLRADGDPRFRGRATEARLAAGETLTQCPPDAEGFASLYEGPYFENFVFRVRLYPGCERNLDGSYTSLDEGADPPRETERDLAWRFVVTSGFAPRRLVTGRLPGATRSLSSDTAPRVYVVDSAGEALFELNATFDSESIRYTFR